jgi:hypothetical protein
VYLAEVFISSPSRPGMILSTVRALASCVTTIDVAAKRNWLSPKLLFDSLNPQEPVKFVWASRYDVVTQKMARTSNLLNFKMFDFLIVA